MKVSELFEAKDSFDALDKELTKVMNKALVSAGFPKRPAKHSGSFAIETSFSKLGVHLYVHEASGKMYDHSVPLSQRQALDSKGRYKFDAPKFLGVHIDVSTNGETLRHTMDGPIGDDKTHFKWNHRFSTNPTSEEITGLQGEVITQMKKAKSVYDGLLKKFQDEDKKKKDKS